MRGAAGAGFAMTALSRSGKFAAAQDEIPLTPSSATVDGTLQVLQKLDFHPDHNQFLKDEIARFAEASGWQVEVSEVGSLNASEIAQRLVAGVQAGNAPDLYFDNAPVHLFQDLGIFQDVTDLATEAQETFGETTPAMLSGAFFNDAWWGVPWFTRVDGWWARRDVFEPAGIDTATLTTLDQRRDAALQVSDAANNMFGWGITINRSSDARALITNVMYHFGSTLQDESGDLVTFNSDETVAAFDWIFDTYSNEKWAPMLPTGWEAWTDTGNNEAFLAGILAMTQNAGTMYAKAVLDQVPFADQIDYMPNALRLSDQQPVDQLGGVLLHVIEGTKNKDAVYDLTRHLLSEPVQQRIWEISLAYAVPAYASGWEDPIIAENSNANRSRPAVWDNETFTGLRWPGPNSVAVDAVGGGFDLVDLVGEIMQGTPTADAVAEYHDRFVLLWQDYGLPGE
jgi:multiple sugar transport system substrate-binding protein